MAQAAATVEFPQDDPIADVKAAMADIEKRETGKEPAGDDAEAVLENASTEAEEARDEKGRFVKKAKTDAPAEKVEAAPQAVTESEVATDVPEAQAVAAQTAVSPPPGWPSEAKAEWSKLSPAIQAAVIKRENEVSRGFAQKSEEMRPWKEIEGIIAPRRAYFQKNGFKTDAEAINHLLSFSDSFERDPAGTIAFLAQQAGVPLPQSAQQNGQVRPAPTPQVDETAIQKMVESQLGMVFARKEIEEFAGDAKSHPHYEELKPLMSTFLMNGQAETLQAAYDAALWATPHLRQLELANMSKPKTVQQEQRVTKAKQATRASLTGAPQGMPAPAAVKYANPHDDVVADIRAAMEQHAR